jgi:hypothetical protein
MKPFTLTQPQITAMIDEINENVTAVNYDTVRDVVATIFDSIDESAYWAKNGEPVTESELIQLVNDWIEKNGPTDPIKITMESAPTPTGRYWNHGTPDRSVLESRDAQPLLDSYKSVPSMGISRNWEF